MRLKKKDCQVQKYWAKAGDFHSPPPPEKNCDNIVVCDHIRFRPHSGDKVKEAQGGYLTVIDVQLILTRLDGIESETELISRDVHVPFLFVCEMAAWQEGLVLPAQSSSSRDRQKRDIERKV